MLKLNLGCGSHVPSGWVNVDYALGAWVAKLPVFSLIIRSSKLSTLTGLIIFFFMTLGKNSLGKIIQLTQFTVLIL
jgi:hypothetical protein